VYSTEKTFNENRDKLDPTEATSFESVLADAKKALDSGNAQTMKDAGERLQQASHRLAEAIYKGAGAGAGAGGPRPSEPESTGKEDEVIDTEYVDTEKQ
jgi:molecular chaperone DnaK